MSIFSLIKFITRHPLNQNNECGAIIRFLRWQLGSRLLPGSAVYEWIGRSRFFVKRGETGLTGNIYCGLHEFSDMAFVVHALRPDDLFVDVGSNSGSYTILACAVAGADGMAFEPVPSTYLRLVENVRLNHMEGRVKCVNKGVGAEEGNIQFTGDSDTTNHALASGEDALGAISVEVITLDKTLKNRCPTIMKIDVEGFESPVLQGANSILRNSVLRAVIIELNGSGVRYGYDESKIVAHMRDHGFMTYTYEPFTRTLKSLDGHKSDSGNTLFARDEAFLRERLITAPRINVLGKTL